MNICFFKDDVNGGGIERVVTTISNKIAINHPEISVFLLDLYKNDEKENYYDLNSSVNYHTLEKKITNKKQIITCNFEIYRYLKENKIDILITSQPLLGLYSIIPAKISSTRHIIWEHGNYFQKQGSKYIDFIRQVELLICEDYIVLTNHDKNIFLDKFKIKSSLKKIYNPIY